MGAGASARRARVELAPGDPHASTRARCGAEEHAQELRAPRSDEPEDAHDLAARDGERDRRDEARPGELLDLHDASGEAEWLLATRGHADAMLRDFEDASGGGGFFGAAHDAEPLLFRAKEPFDEEKTGWGWKTIGLIKAQDTVIPTTCKMNVPS